jgi:hypothetical protein
MSKGLLIGGSIAAILVVTLIGCVLWMVGIFNTEIGLRNRFDAQKKKIETSHDKMWKTISQQYQIKGDYEKTFKDGLFALASGRAGGALFKSNTESNTQLGLSSEMFTKVMNTVEGLRGELQREQNTWVDVWREHKTFCQRIPNNIFVGGRIQPEPVMITSTRTKEAMTTGVDDDVELNKTPK